MPFGGIPQAKGEEEESATWYITYGDTFTLMVTFFILLFASATFDPVKYAKFVEAEELKRYEQLLDSTKTAIDKFVEANRLQNELSVKREETAIRLVVSADVSFAAGKADLKPDVQPILNSIGDILRGGVYNVIVSGHTDNIPMRGNKDFPTNWELSSERALSVTRYFISKGFPPTVFRSEGLAEFHPILPDTVVAATVTPEIVAKWNATPELRSRNRRIEIVISPDWEYYRTRFRKAA